MNQNEKVQFHSLVKLDFYGVRENEILILPDMRAISQWPYPLQTAMLEVLAQNWLANGKVIERTGCRFEGNLWISKSSKLKR